MIVYFREMGKHGISKLSNGKKTRMELISFKLVDVHTSLFGAPPSLTHSAEADALALMRITAALGPEFMEDLCSSAIPFSSVEPMW